jgi:small ligand-binding sensory domain FIST
VRIGVGVSTAREARQAAVGATEHARDELAGEVPSLAVLLASRSHTDKARDVLNAVQEMVEPPALIGCVAQAIVAGRHEIEDEAAVAVWLASGLAAETFQLDFVRTGSGGLLTGYRFDRSAHDLHLLLPDPYTFPSNLLIEHLNTDLPGTTVVGGVVSGGLGPGDTRLFRDRDVLTSGVVGVRLPGMHGVPIVSQGCRPIGQPYIVTGADGALITELGGRPPLQRLREIVEGLQPDEQELVSHGLQIGIVVDEHLAAPGQGDFMIRGLLGADPSTGAIEIGEVVEVGATVQFQVRDAVGADKDLHLAVERAGAQLPGRVVVHLQRAWATDVRGRRPRRVDDRGITWRDSARRFLRRRGDRPDRGPQRVARIHRFDGAVHRRHGVSLYLDAIFAAVKDLGLVSRLS